MGRPMRIQFPGACYHVQLRSRRGQELFAGDDDRRRFLELLEGHRRGYGLRVYAYALLADRAHLVIETEQANLSRAMQAFNTRYTKYVNRSRRSRGPVLAGRYRAYLVDKEEYLVELTRYVHLSPVVSGEASKPWRFRWSSCADYVETELRSGFVDSAPVLRCFGKTRLRASVRYLQFLKEKLRGRIEFALPVQKGAFLGGPEFALRTSSLSSGEEAPAPTIEEILVEVLDKHGTEREDVLGRSQRRVHAAARREAIYRAWKEGGLPLAEIGRFFNRTPSAVCQLIQAVDAA